jgi:ribosomal protein L31E
MDILIEVLSKVVRDGVTTDTLSERLAPSLRIFLRIVKNIDSGESLIQISSGSTPLNSSASESSDFFKKHEVALEAIKTFIMKSETIDLDVDLDNLQQVNEAIKHKRINKVPNTIKILAGIAKRCGPCTNSEKAIFKESSYVKRVFKTGTELI